MDKESGPAFDQDCQQQKLFEAWMDKRKEAKLKKDNFPNYPPENMKNVKTGSPSPTRRGFARNHRIQEEASQKEYFEQIREASNFVLPAHATSTLITALEKNPKKRREDILSTWICCISCFQLTDYFSRRAPGIFRSTRLSSPAPSYSELMVQTSGSEGRSQTVSNTHQK